MTEPATDELTIDSSIKTMNQICTFLQIQGTYKHKLTIGERGGTVLGRAESTTPQSLPDPGDVVHKLNVTLRQLKRDLKYMYNIQSDVEAKLRTQLYLLKRLAKGAEYRMKLTKGIKMDLEDVTKDFLEILSKVPEKRKKTKASPGYQDGHGYSKDRRILCLPAIHGTEKDLKRLAVFRKVRDEFEKLSAYRQICLLSFAVFLENQEVNRTMLMYWWIGEGILPIEVNPEVTVENILQEFMEKKLIEAVENKRKLEPSSYKMTPFVHSSVVLISAEIGLFDMYHEREDLTTNETDFHTYRRGRKPTMNQSDLNKVCLVEGSSSQQEAKGKKIKNVDYIETVFNVSEMFPEFTGKWFTSMKKLKVLYLGRWERTEHEIKMDSRRVMKDLSSLRRLRFLSFQGISTIKSLSRSACKLTELVILDLRDCYNLEKLPRDIQKLKNLVYLDLTGCEALESIPVELAWLAKLEVLKGFVVADDREIPCKLSYLQKLPKLRKLSVSVDREDFGLHEVIVAIRSFKKLEKLKVRWRSGIPQSVKQQDENAVDMLPEQLKKLDLQCFSDIKLPNWLQPQNLNHLEKLHLGSWRFLEGFGALRTEKAVCSVKVLRLTCLPRLRVEWRDLKRLYFPNIKILESYKCPRVTFSPCDRDGIWRSDTL